MFIVNQNGDECELLRSVSYYVGYDEVVKNALKEIDNRALDNSYNFGGVLEAKKISKQRQMDYLATQKDRKMLYLVVNGNEFAKYYDIEHGEKIFSYVVSSIAEEKKIIDLSKLNVSDL